MCVCVCVGGGQTVVERSKPRVSQRPPTLIPMVLNAVSVGTVIGSQRLIFCVHGSLC
jgi:hypothetical protein